MTSIRQILLTIFVVYFLDLATAYAIPYFKGNSLTPTLLEMPFKSDSPERKAEIEHIVKLQNNLDQVEALRASEEYFMRPEDVFQLSLPELTRKDYPNLFRLLDYSEETARETKDIMKAYWNMPRPYKMTKKIKKILPLKPSSSNSYPSGHATRSYTVAYVLGLLIPEKREEFSAMADQITSRRVLIGEHFPSEIVAGKRLALLVVGGLIQNDEFQRDLEIAREEIERKGKKKFWW